MKLRMVLFSALFVALALHLAAGAVYAQAMKITAGDVAYDRTVDFFDKHL